jgi:hypothetical protein
MACESLRTIKCQCQGGTTCEARGIIRGISLPGISEALKQLPHPSLRLPCASHLVCSLSRTVTRIGRLALLGSPKKQSDTYSMSRSRTTSCSSKSNRATITAIERYTSALARLFVSIVSEVVNEERSSHSLKPLAHPWSLSVYNEKSVQIGSWLQQSVVGCGEPPFWSKDCGLWEYGGVAEHIVRGEAHGSLRGRQCYILQLATKLTQCVPLQV